MKDLNEIFYGKNASNKIQRFKEGMLGMERVQRAKPRPCKNSWQCAVSSRQVFSLYIRRTPGLHRIFKKPVDHWLTIF